MRSAGGEVGDLGGAAVRRVAIILMCSWALLSFLWWSGQGESSIRTIGLGVCRLVTRIMAGTRLGSCIDGQGSLDMS